MAPLVLGLAMACAAGLLTLGPLAPMAPIAVAIALVVAPPPPRWTAVGPRLRVAPKTSPPRA
jgi:hypothetical protein